MSRNAAVISLRSILRESKSRLPSLKSENVSGFLEPSKFHETYLKKARPGHFANLVNVIHSPYYWSACAEWPGKSAEPLAGLRCIPELQEHTVTVEVAEYGHGYGDGVKQDRHSAIHQAHSASWTQVEMPFSIFLDGFIDGRIPWEFHDKSLVGYVAQQDLFQVSQTLSRQCPPLPHTLAGSRGDKEQWRRNMWLGGEGTFTPIHCDPYENIFVQVAGTKRVHLFPPCTRPHLQMFDSLSMQPNTSMITSEAPLLENDETPSSTLQHALSHPDSCHAILRPGDALYIPQGWFHCVGSTSVSASVNAWFR